MLPACWTAPRSWPCRSPDRVGALGNTSRRMPSTSAARTSRWCGSRSGSNSPCGLSPAADHAEFGDDPTVEQGQADDARESRRPGAYKQGRQNLDRIGAASHRWAGCWRHSARSLHRSSSRKRHAAAVNGNWSSCAARPATVAAATLMHTAGELDAASAPPLSRPPLPKIHPQGPRRCQPRACPAVSAIESSRRAPPCSAHASVNSSGVSPGSRTSSTWPGGLHARIDLPQELPAPGRSRRQNDKLLIHRGRFTPSGIRFKTSGGLIGSGRPQDRDAAEAGPCRYSCSVITIRTSRWGKVRRKQRTNWFLGLLQTRRCQAIWALDQQEDRDRPASTPVPDAGASRLCSRWRPAMSSAMMRLKSDCCEHLVHLRRALPGRHRSGWRPSAMPRVRDESRAGGPHRRHSRVDQSDSCSDGQQADTHRRRARRAVR